MTDHYATLGVARTASADEIKQAYRRLASQHHPDRGGNTAKFQEIQAAYEVLGNEQARTRYDNPAAGFAHGPPGGPHFDFNNIFDVFGARFQQRQHARMSLWISLRDVAIGGSRAVNISVNGNAQTVEINIPTGIEDGDNVQYARLAPGGQDLVVTFRVHPDKQWHRSGNTLTTEVMATVWQLILGDTINVLDIQGNKLEVTIPPRTQTNALLRVKARGLPDREGRTGDMLIRLVARIPPVISPELLLAIQQEVEK